MVSMSNRFAKDMPDCDEATNRVDVSKMGNVIPYSNKDSIVVNRAAIVLI